MKRFMFLSIGFLFSIIISAVDSDVMAQPPGGVKYYSSTSYILAMLPNGDTYAASIDGTTRLLGPTIYLGNFWAAIGEPIPDTQYFVNSNGNINAVAPDGRVFRGQITGDHLDPTVFSGYLWDDIVANENATWGGVKGQYNK